MCLTRSRDTCMCTETHKLNAERRKARRRNRSVVTQSTAFSKNAAPEHAESVFNVNVATHRRAPTIQAQTRPQGSRGRVVLRPCSEGARSDSLPEHLRDSHWDDWVRPQHRPLPLLLLSTLLLPLLLALLLLTLLLLPLAPLLLSSLLLLSTLSPLLPLLLAPLLLLLVLQLEYLRAQRSCLSCGASCLHRPGTDARHTGRQGQAQAPYRQLALEKLWLSHALTQGGAHQTDPGHHHHHCRCRQTQGAVAGGRHADGVQGVAAARVCRVGRSTQGSFRQEWGRGPNSHL